MKNIKDRTYNLAYSELEKYGINADLCIEHTLSSFEIRRINNQTVIAASNEIELLYGVYEFAEKFGGWNFFAPGKDEFKIERKVKILSDGILIPAKRPLLKRRGFIQEFSFNDETEILFDWMAKNKMNYLLVWMKYYDELSDELKEFARIRGIEIESGHHNFNYWIPGKIYANTHPDFFAEINGRRINPSAKDDELLLSEQLCTTNPELRSEIVRHMAEYCDRHPEVKTISLVPNDGFGWCECEKCSKFYDKNNKGDYYSISSHVYKANKIYHDMVRNIREKLNISHPDIQLTFCAYINYCSPSENFFLEKGMAVHFAPYWRCINHVLNDPECEINSAYLRDIKKWSAVKKGGEINIYEYFMGVNFYLSLPMIHREKMFKEIQWYSQNGVDGLLTQFHISHWTVYGMNYRLMAKAARNGEQSAISEMLAEIFGKDAQDAENFYREIERIMQNMGKCHIPYPRSLFRRTKLNQFEHIHDLACSLAAKEPQDKFRHELCIWCEYLVRFKKLADKLFAEQAKIDDIDNLLNWIHSFRDSRIFVHQKFDIYFNAVKEAIKSGRPWIHFNIDWEDKYILAHDSLLN